MLKVYKSIICILLAVIILGCVKAQPKAVTDTLPEWKREHYQRGDGRALIRYIIYGEFTNDVRISREEYRTAGLPERFSLRKLNRRQRDPLPFADGEFAKALHDSVQLDQIRNAPEC